MAADGAEQSHTRRGDCGASQRACSVCMQYVQCVARSRVVGRSVGVVVCSSTGGRASVKVTASYCDDNTATETQVSEAVCAAR